MARSSSQSQSSVGGAGAGARPATVGPRSTAAAAASTGGGGFSGGGGSNMLRFYTDEAPGLRLSPTMVLVMSLCFIGFGTAPPSTWSILLLGLLGQLSLLLGRPGLAALKARYLLTRRGKEQRRMQATTGSGRGIKPRRNRGPTFH
ncbi:hypothetical protein SEVIR_8G000851v4 [Setaria viridis]|nr:protein transport protein Sec61 subunit beta-like [Setaria viridis]